MKEVKVKSKFKVEVSPKIAVSVILVCIGVVAGSLMLSVTSAVCTTDNCGVVSQLTTLINTNTGWLKSQTTWMEATDYSTLNSAFANGADMKILQRDTALFSISYSCLHVFGSIGNNGSLSCKLKDQNNQDKAFTVGNNFITTVQTPTTSFVATVKWYYKY